MFIKDLPKIPKRTRHHIPSILDHQKYANDMEALLPELKEIIKFYNANKPDEGEPILVVRDDSRKFGSRLVFSTSKNKNGRFQILANTDKFNQLDVITPDVRVNIVAYQARKKEKGFIAVVSVSSRLHPPDTTGRENIQLTHFDDSRGWNVSLRAFGHRFGEFLEWMKDKGDR